MQVDLVIKIYDVEYKVVIVLVVYNVVIVFLASCFVVMDLLWACVKGAWIRVRTAKTVASLKLEISSSSEGYTGSWSWWNPYAASVT